MAIYHFTAQAISRSAGRSSTAVAAYRAGERITDERTGQTFDYRKKSGVEHSEIMAPANAPEWATDRARLWNTVEIGEKRKDSQVAREVEMALPVELDHSKQLPLVRGFVRSQFVDSGMVADFNIHRPKHENPHCHVMLTMRDIGPDGFGQKNRSWNDKALLESWREKWAEHVNHALEHDGHTARVDHRTLEAQGIDRIPQGKLGVKVVEMEARGIRTERGTAALEIEHHNKQLAELQAELEAIRNERNHEAPASPGPRPDSRSLGAAGREHGGTGRPVEGSRRAVENGSVPERPRVAGASEPIGLAGTRAGRSLDQNGAEHGATGRAVAAGTDAGDVVHSGDGGHVVHPRSHAIDRVMALAGTVGDGAKHARPDAGGGTPQARDHRGTETRAAPVDRSYIAARRQLDAMGADAFEVGIRDQAGRMLIRTWSKDKTLDSLAWLKRENAKGADVYVRPAGESSAGLVLVDDLNRGQLVRMKADGFAPASLTETSPDNFQAWVRIHDKPIPPELATAAAAELASRYGGDPNSADWRHFGRLAGLTNQKPHHRDGAGRAPYVLAHDSTGKQAEAGRALLREVAQRQLDRDAKAERDRRMKATETAQEPRRGATPADTYRYGLRALVARFGASMDVSKADYMIGQDMARRGFSADQIGTAIKEASPELPTRKAGHEADYVARTVKAVMESPKVQEWRAEQERQQQARPSRSNDRDHGPSR